jgi:hypothetical protein
VDMARESLHAVERLRGSGLGKGSAIKRPDAEIILSADPFLDMPLSDQEAMRRMPAILNHSRALPQRDGCVASRSFEMPLEPSGAKPMRRK